MNRLKKVSLILAGLLSVAHADDIASLKQKIAELESRQNALAEQMDTPSSSFLGSKTHIGGYGELHYNNLDGKGAGTADKREIDFHRFVLMFNHEFSDKIKLYTELELEHSLAGESKPGEVELEQAYIDFKIADHHHLNAGLFLVPVGLLNESHEPETFYGVERNAVEKNIIPTTWWEAGLGFHGSVSPKLKYNVALHSGLGATVSANTLGKIRSGRQKVASATAENLAFTGRLAWTPVSALQLSAVINHQTDLAQGTHANVGSATLYNLNADYQVGSFRLRALYATWDVSGSVAKSNGADEQTGFYLEPSYKLCEKWGVFARYSSYDNTAGSNGGNSEMKQYDLGVNYWPHPQVVVKLDVQNQDNDNNKDLDGFNLGVGYSF